MGYGLWFWLWFSHRKIRLTQLWVELSWVVAKRKRGTREKEVKGKDRKMREGKNEKPLVDLKCGPAQPSLFTWPGHWTVSVIYHNLI